MSIFECPSYYNEVDSYVYAAIKPVLRTECLNLEDSLHRVLAEDITTLKSIPPFSRALMDGYAVKAKDTVGASPDSPKIFEIIDYLYAGGVSKKYISANECVHITTGAKIPDGADAVVMTENTGIENGRLCIYKPVNYGDNIEAEGQDIKKGRVLLKQGTALNPSRTGLIASQGISNVKVYEKPKIAIISNGEELAAADDILKDGQIYDVNSFMIGAIVKENGCLPLKFGIVGDNPQQIKALIDEALKVSDFVFISGGSSKGDRDFLFEILQKLGRVPSFKTKPENAKSGIFVISEGKPVLGTPGFPTSCLINAYVLLVPALRKMAQLPYHFNKSLDVKMSEDIDVAKSITGCFLPVKIEGERAFPVVNDNKGLINIAKADGYIILNEEIATIEAGSEVSVTLF
ncbi:MAG: molybdopterin molybdotransferase MoeA [Dehalococcoidales bacterium]|nr:molybdopterin molybdotransferase MoeA [Dehalococcoidales bacterium]